MNRSRIFYTSQASGFIASQTYGPEILIHQEFTLAAVDDIIRRGGWRDWVELRRAAHRDHTVLARIARLCAASSELRNAEGAQRITFWRKYAGRLAAGVG